MKTAVVTLLVLASGAAQAQEFRETAVPNAQIPAVVRDVAEWHDMQHPDCRFVKAIGSTTLQKNSDGSDERWTIEACSGKTYAYKVVVFPEPDGGVTDMVGNIDNGDSANRKETTPPPPVQADCAEMQRKFDALNADKNPDADHSRTAQIAADLAVCNSGHP